MHTPETATMPSALGPKPASSSRDKSKSSLCKQTQNKTTTMNFFNPESSASGKTVCRNPSNGLQASDIQTWRKKTHQQGCVRDGDHMTHCRISQLLSTSPIPQTLHLSKPKSTAKNFLTGGSKISKEKIPLSQILARGRKQPTPKPQRIRLV